MKLVNLILFLGSISYVFCSLIQPHRRDIRSVARNKARKRLSRSTTVQLEIALTPSNTDSPEDLLLQVSHPGSPEYGRHWTPQQITERFSPRAESVLEVTHWLREAGISTQQIHRSLAGGHILADLSVGEVEDLLRVTCHTPLDREQEDTWVDCGPFTVPRTVLSAIDYLAISQRPAESSPTRRSYWAAAPLLDERDVPSLDVPRSNANNVQSRQTALDCGLYSTPACLRELYNITYPGNLHPENSFGIYMQAYMTWLSDDMDRFFDLFQPEMVGRRPVVESINGGYRQWDFNITPFNLEPHLDFQYSMALTGLNVTNLQVGDAFLGGNLNTMLAAFDEYYCDALDAAVDPIYPNSLPSGYNASDCGTIVPPKVVSISFGWVEAEFSREYLERQCQEILKLGLMGVTVVIASGDSGTQAGIPPGGCIDPETGDTNATTGAFNPTWPASCPWITTVGGTSRSKGRTSSQHWERAWSHETSDYNYTTGGGFSKIFPAPEYQQNSLARYMDIEGQHLDDLEEKGYHPAELGRGFPDLSLLAESYPIYLYNRLITVHGTSASAQAFASMVALINNERLLAGKGPVGFINPAIYSHPETFNDVVDGANEGCGVSPAYRATKGWDAVTGLGSPDFERLKDMFLQLP